MIAGQDYGAGSSRDWAAKGTRLLGVRAVVARGFERIHRSNLIDLGVLPCELPGGRELGDARARWHRAVRPGSRADLCGLAFRRRLPSNAATAAATRCRSWCASIPRSRRPTFRPAASCPMCSISC